MLRVLRSCLQENGGWKWRGVRGWMFTYDFPYHLSGLASGFLSTLADNYLVDREDVRDPFVQRPVNLYRITQLGIDLLADWEREQRAAPRSAEAEPGVIPLPVPASAGPADESAAEPISVSPPAESRSEEELESIFIASHQWTALAFLQTQPLEKWLTAREIRPGAPRFNPNDAYLLVDKALAEESLPEEGERRYRASRLGRNARLRDDKANERMVMIHVPGIRAAAAAGLGHAHTRQREQRRSGPISGG